MKTTVQNQLRSFQSRIQRRLARENRNSEDDGRPVLRGINAIYEVSDRVRAVPAGGIKLIQQLAKALGLDKETDKHAQLLKVHRP